MSSFFSSSQATSRGRRVKRPTVAPERPAKSRGLLQRDRIFALLQASRGVFLTSSEIDERLELPANAASKVMTHLVREGKVKYEDGRYGVAA